MPMESRNTIRPYGSGCPLPLTPNPARYRRSFARERRNRFRLLSRSPRRGSICCRFAASSTARNVPRRKGSACTRRTPGPATNMFWWEENDVPRDQANSSRGDGLASAGRPIAAAVLRGTLAAFGFDDRLAMGTKVLDVPHQARVNFIVIGNVGPAKAEGVLVTGMLGEGARGSQQREQKCSGREF